MRDSHIKARAQRPEMEKAKQGPAKSSQHETKQHQICVIRASDKQSKTSITRATKAKRLDTSNSREMTETGLYINTQFRIPITVIHSPEMPTASKISERPFTWSECKQIIGANDLEAFARSKSQTEAYLGFKRKLRESNSTVFKNLVVETLKWASADEVAGKQDSEIKIESSGCPLFTNASDLKIVLNDFPYYFEDDVTHFCVWTKRHIPSDCELGNGDISESTRSLIQKYVDRTFVEGLGLPKDHVLWLRNWAALQSVKEISHIHVLVKGMTQEQINSILDGPGIPLAP